MKRLRAPEQSDSRAASPSAAAAPPDTAAAPQPASDPSAAPAAAAPPEGATAVITELPAGPEISQPAPEEAASDGEPQQPRPAPQEAEPTSRCNGEAALNTATEGGDEQG